MHISNIFDIFSALENVPIGSRDLSARFYWDGPHNGFLFNKHFLFSSKRVIVSEKEWDPECGQDEAKTKESKSAEKKRKSDLAEQAKHKNCRKTDKHLDKAEAFF